VLSKDAVMQGSEDSCKCGCGGFCTLYPCLQVLSWDLSQAARGEFDVAGPFGEELSPMVHYRYLLRKGQGMKTTIAIIEITGDWPAWADISGIRYWSHNIFPCGACDMNLHDLKLQSTINSMTTDSGPWTCYNHPQWQHDVSSHEIVLTLMINLFSYISTYTYINVFIHK
jgi:hypothetical protein